MSTQEVLATAQVFFSNVFCMRKKRSVRSDSKAPIDSMIDKKSNS